jgi:predicted amidohydrolase
VELRIALAQVAPHLGDLDANLDLVKSRLGEAVAQGADLAVFPELALTGYLLQDLVPDVAIRADDERLLAIGADAPEVMVAVGFVEETRARRYCNSVALLRGGRLIGLHRKVYLPTYGLFDEGRFTRGGNQIRATEVGDPLHKVGLSICEDFWHPFLPMLQVQDGALLLINVAAGPARAPGSAAGLAAIGGWHKMQETYALLGTVAVAFCNRVGNEEGLTFWGGSRLLGADGSVLAEAPLYEEALVMGVLETDDLRMQRYNLPLVGDERLELVRREVDRIIAERAGMAPPPELAGDDAEMPLPAMPPSRKPEPQVEREVERA